MAIWHNGILSETASIDATSAGLLLGWGVFTTIGIKEGRPLWLDHHLARVRRDAARCDIVIPYSDEELRAAFADVLQTNGIQYGLARLTATRRNDDRWNTTPATDVTLLALESPAPKIRGIRVGFVPAPSQGELSGVKTTSYLPYFWSWHQAHQRGLDEVVLLNDSLVVEAARSSVFWVEGGLLQTSPLNLGALDGIGRALTFEWAKAQGIEVATAQISLCEFLDCDEALLISAATGPRAIGSFVTAYGEIALPNRTPLFERFRAWWDSQ